MDNRLSDLSSLLEKALGPIDTSTLLSILEGTYPVKNMSQNDWEDTLKGMESLFEITQAMENSEKRNFINNYFD